MRFQATYPGWWVLTYQDLAQEKHFLNKGEILESDQRFTVYYNGIIEPQLKPMLSQYVYHQNKRRGMLVALLFDGKVYIGWSACSPKDEFDRQEAFDLAKKRALDMSQGYPLPPMKRPAFIDEMLPVFKKRCNRYFQRDFEIA